MEEEKQPIKTDDITTRYLKQLIIPFLIAVIFEIAAQFLPNSNMVVWLANFFLLLYLAWLIQKDKQVKNQGIFWIGFATFLLLDLVVAFAKLVINWQFWYFLNLLTEPLIYAIIGGALTYLAVVGYQKLFPVKPVKEAESKNNKQ
ncbi:MAG: hypothetical protein ABH835_03325 [Patescibacteria group bacterium]